MPTAIGSVTEVSELQKFQPWYLFPEEYNLLQFHVRENVTDMLIKHWRSEIHLESFCSNLSICFQIFGLIIIVCRDTSWNWWSFQLDGFLPTQLIQWILQFKAPNVKVLSLFSELVNHEHKEKHYRNICLYDLCQHISYDRTSKISFTLVNIFPDFQWKKWIIFLHMFLIIS